VLIGFGADPPVRLMKFSTHINLKNKKISSSPPLNAQERWTSAQMAFQESQIAQESSVGMREDFGSDLNKVGSLLPVFEGSPFFESI